MTTMKNSLKISTSPFLLHSFELRISGLLFAKNGAFKNLFAINKILGIKNITFD